MRIDGSQRTIVKWEDKSYPLDPAISPDGKRIAYSLQGPARTLADGSLDFGSDIHVLNSDGKDDRQLVSHQRVAEFLRTPAWLSDSELLYTYRGRDATGLSDFRIEKLDLKTLQSTRVIANGIDPVLSRDRRQIAFVEVDPKTDIETLFVAGSDLKDRKALVDSRSSLALFSAAVFSPDGTRIAFAAVDLTSPLPGGALLPTGLGFFAAHPFAQDVWIVNIDGSGLHRAAELAENMPSLTWAGDSTTLYVLGPGALWKVDTKSARAEKVGPGIPLGQIIWLSGP